MDDHPAPLNQPHGQLYCTDKEYNLTDMGYDKDNYVKYLIPNIGVNGFPFSTAFYCSLIHAIPFHSSFFSFSQNTKPSFCCASQSSLQGRAVIKVETGLTVTGFKRERPPLRRNLRLERCVE